MGRWLGEAAGRPRAAQREHGCLPPLQSPAQAQHVATFHPMPISEVVHNPGLTLRRASQISCWSLLGEFFFFLKGILAIVEMSKCGLHSVCLGLGLFLWVQSHIPSKCCLVIGIFLSHSQHESDTKFILILDRRLDTWTSVKMTLQKIAVSPL